MKNIVKWRGEEGIALIFALGFLTLLMFLALGFAANSLVERKIAANNNARTQAKYLAEAGLTRALATLKVMSEGTEFPVMPRDFYYAYTADWNSDMSVGYNYTKWGWSGEDRGKLEDNRKANPDYARFLDAFKLKVGDRTVYSFEEEDLSVGDAFKRNADNDSRFSYSYIKTGDRNDSPIIGRIAYLVLPTTVKVDLEEMAGSASRQGKSLKELDLSVFKVEEDADGKAIDLDELDDSFKWRGTAFVDLEKFTKQNSGLEQMLAVASLVDEGLINENVSEEKLNEQVAQYDAVRGNLWSYLGFHQQETPQKYYFYADGSSSQWKKDDERFFKRYNLSKPHRCSGSNSGQCVEQFLTAEPIHKGEKEDVDNDHNNPADRNVIQFFRMIGDDKGSFDSLADFRRQVVANFLDFTDEDNTPHSNIAPASWSLTNMPSYTGNEKTPYISEFRMDIVPALKIKKNETDEGVSYEVTARIETLRIIGELCDYFRASTGTYDLQLSGTLTVTANLGGKNETKELRFEAKDFTNWVAGDHPYGYYNIETGTTSLDKVISQEFVQDTSGDWSPLPILSMSCSLKLDNAILRRTVGDADNEAGVGVDAAKINRQTTAWVNLTDDYYRNLEHYFTGSSEISMQPRLISCEAKDARQNLNPGDWGDMRSDVVATLDNASFEVSNQHSIGKLNNWFALSDDAARDEFRSMQKSLENSSSGEWPANGKIDDLVLLGRISRGAPWQTINLKGSGIGADYYKPDFNYQSDGGSFKGVAYEDGDGALLDQVTLGGSKKRLSIDFPAPVLYAERDDKEKIFTMEDKYGTAWASGGRLYDGDDVEKYADMTPYLYQALFKDVLKNDSKNEKGREFAVSLVSLIKDEDDFQRGDNVDNKTVFTCSYAGRQFLLNPSGLLAMKLKDSNGKATDETLRDYWQGDNDKEQEESVVKVMGLVQTGELPTEFQVLVVAQSILDVGGIYGRPIDVTRFDRTGRERTRGCVLGTFDYDAKNDVYYDEITGEVRLLATVVRNPSNNELKVVDIRYLD